MLLISLVVSMSHRNIPKNSQRGSRQVHKNKTKFDPNRYKDSHERLDLSFVDVMTSLCCKRCCDKIQWKYDYGKYQSFELPRKCNRCTEKKLVLAYHHICQECSKITGHCAKCQRPPTSEASHSDENDDSGEETRIPEVLLRYAFVDEPCEDPEFAHLQGLDIRRLVAHKKRLAIQAERDERLLMRERERRTVVRQDRRNKEATSITDSDDELE